jgi:hypothetical protein
MGIPAPEGWFQREFDRGRWLAMLDGLDEVADAETPQDDCRMGRKNAAAALPDAARAQTA